MGDVTYLAAHRPQQAEERWLKRAELARHFDVTARTVTRWQARGLPHAKTGGVVRFPLGECEDWFRNQPDRRTR